MLHIDAFRFVQNGRDLYTAVADGRTLAAISRVPRITRDDDGTLDGYQRAEVGPHIRAIVDYIRSDGAFIPNAVTIAFDPTVTFTPHPGVADGAPVTPGTLTIPDGHPALIVDGQQRIAAVREADQPFPLPFTAFISDTVASLGGRILTSSPT